MAIEARDSGEGWGGLMLIDFKLWGGLQ